VTDQPNIRTLSVRHLPEAIKVAIQTRDPLVILGPPGIAKTAISRQMAEILEMQYTEMLLAGRDIGDIMMPYVAPPEKKILEDGTIVDLPTRLQIHYSHKIPHVDNPAFTGPTLLNIDEFSGAKPMMQNVLLKVLDEWLIGETRLRDDVAIIATGNRSWDRAHVEKLSAALGNRANIIHFEPDADFWLEWGLKSGIHPLVLAWVKFDPSNLFEFDDKAFQAGDFAFPSPRSNERLSNLLWERDNNSMNIELFRAMASGAIGQVKGAKFASWIRIQDKLPDLDAILAGQSQPAPTDPSVCHAVIYALIQRSTRDNFQHVCKYMGHFPEEWHMMYTNSVVHAKPELIATQAWGKWITDHPDTLS
jgi:hypothetical protein